ncbi:hypothetical protein [Streptomyces sp. CB03238]|uniref:hypothetical protein n=1 Tax=Streptomyces sp. CB03238 TaxID=1907777 RepID=UPI000A106EBB|nr:hypothetical protein [Streptomyces sp. CB03238]ORT54736.1 hypothetical protein BKD26_34335 [Streptomyces sp. CB03238]
MNAAPAGPLDGAARTRPDGWLANPLSTDHALAERQAHALLHQHHPDAPSPARCISARYRTAAFALGDPPVQLLKRHADEAAYLGEMLAYEVLADEQVLPALYSSSDSSRTLVVDYLSHGVDLTDADAFDELIHRVAVVHTASARWHPAVAGAMSSWRVEIALSSPAADWISSPADWHDLMRLMADAHGPDHVPLGHLDLKPDHVRRHPDDGLALIDAETLRPDLTGLPDLITLAYIAGSNDRYPRPRWIRHAYLRHVNELGAQWTGVALVNALTAFATATGLHSLHGAQS